MTTTPDPRTVQLFVDLAELREQTYAHLVAAHGPDEAARLWQAALDAHARHLRTRPAAPAGGTERGSLARGHVASGSAPAAGAGLHPGCVACPADRREARGPTPGRFSGAGEPVVSTPALRQGDQAR